ncbi:MAG: hypothetical protein WEA09_02720 [Gemmatimonadota bacterium]
MKHSITRVIVAGILLMGGLAACDDNLTVPNLNNPSKEDLTSAPSKSVLAAAVQGIISGQRGLKAGMVGRMGVWGRESYDLRPEEPRPYTDALIDPLGPVNGGQLFGGQYTQVAHINAVIAASENATGITDVERRAVAGFAKTFKADALWQVLIGRPLGIGIPLEPDADPTAELSPIAPPAAAVAFILDLYDEAAADLQAGGTAFPFSLTVGMSDFNTPGSFIPLNRALKARVLKYDGQWGAALAAIGASFIDEDGDLSAGAYFNYSTISGDATNGFFGVPTDYAHPRVRDDAQLQPGGELDQRALDKTAIMAAPVTTFGITVTERTDAYKSQTAPLPWITNEELILMRAEAQLGNANPGLALEDVNRIRVRSGGLAALPAAFAGDLLDEILYNRFMSLFHQGGFHYLDMRQYDKLNELPRALPIHKVYLGFPYPLNECLARDIMSGPECEEQLGT